MTDDRTARLEARVAELAGMPAEALKDMFWELNEAVVAPLVDLARTHTTPSIERSVLLRMGVDSLTSHGVVDHIHEAGLLGKGAGQVVLRVAQRDGLGIREAAAAIAGSTDVLTGLFPGGGSR
ncbi:MAG TPA: D-ornithine 4,5-aminomutase subunit OraS [Candidatus Lustribacter sp.]|jgi:D-ornithine 4,5-aminomutase subunit alpha|nr:D-ornithine 4,5-aminomutase subunit OraS [Candidatus Lustribacter sp.]